MAELLLQFATHRAKPRVSQRFYTAKTLVTRGEDLFPATHVHRLLQALLDRPVPEWHHHGLLNDASGKRLAKRHDPLTLRALRRAGRSPAEVRALAGFPDEAP